ncbi:MAG: aminotransferase class I/II-fold pyridoxal phosphate-dependent enzyme [Bacteroidia bacterium]|nr:aminotransferase class I/II-fold pyridoxal phosphate-dependent enzyme [Bacteroidia bacterium]
MDIFDKIARNMRSDLGKYAEMGHGYFSFPKLEGQIQPKMHFMGEEVLCWSLNNYLGLANHPEVRKADTEATTEWGLAYPMGSRMLTGNTDYHEEFEKKVSAFMEKEDAYLLNFGYQGLVSIVQALVDRKDVIVYDHLSHACIIDGMLLSQAKRFVFAHNDMAQLDDRLQKATKYAEQTGGGILVITEGVFGMKGDTGKLDEIVRLKSKYKFRLLIDDAHGFGVMGPTGAGTAEHYGVQKDVDIIFCTFAKSMALIGAFVAGDKTIIQYLRYHMRSQIYAKTLPLPIVIGALKRLELLMNHPELRTKLWDITHALQQGLRERNFDIGITTTPVTPVYLKGGVIEATLLTKDLRHNYHIFVSIVTYPVVEKGVIILRIIPTAAHSIEDVQTTLEAFSAVRQKLDTGIYTNNFVAN